MNIPPASPQLSAPDLTQRPPRSPCVRLGGYVMLARTIDAELATGKGDGEILIWVQNTAKPARGMWEIKAWSDFMMSRTPDCDVETLNDFAEAIGKFSAVREDIHTWFEYLDLDDHCSFGGKA